MFFTIHIQTLNTMKTRLEIPKGYLLVLLLLLFSVPLFCQISGPSEVDLNDTLTYTNTNGPCGGACITYTWTASNAIFIGSPTETQIQLYYTTEGFYDIELRVIDNYGQNFLVDVLTVKVGNPRKINFSYDASGNRIQRETVYLTQGGLKSLSSADSVKIEEPEFSKELKVYPNPFRETFYLTLDDEAYKAKQKEVLLYDQLGKLIHQYELYDYINELDASDLKEGTYILKLRYENRSREWLIIKN